MILFIIALYEFIEMLCTTRGDRQLQSGSKSVKPESTTACYTSYRRARRRFSESYNNRPRRESTATISSAENIKLFRAIRGREGISHLLQAAFSRVREFPGPMVYATIRTTRYRVDFQDDTVRKSSISLHIVQLEYKSTFLLFALYALVTKIKIVSRKSNNVSRTTPTEKKKSKFCVQFSYIFSTRIPTKHFYSKPRSTGN